jgi:hypothetical protein
MKDTMKIVGLFFGSLIVVVQLALVAVLFKPEVFRFVGVIGAPSVASAPSVPDSVTISTAEMVPVDSVRQLAALVRNSQAAQQTLTDSIRDLTIALEEEQKKIRDLRDVIGSTLTAEDSSRHVARQALADFLGSMNAEEAARILRNMDDREAREVLLRVKKRQAGKILSTLDPAEAVKIMR